LNWLSEKLQWSGLSGVSRGLGKRLGRDLWDVDSDPPAPKPKLQSTEVGLQITDEKRRIARRGYKSRIVRVLR
jgi:hypothetical protein